MKSSQRGKKLGNSEKLCAQIAMQLKLTGYVISSEGTAY